MEWAKSRYPTITKLIFQFFLRFKQHIPKHIALSAKYQELKYWGVWGVWGLCPQTPQTASSLRILATRLIAAAWIRPLSLWPKHYAALPPSCINLSTMNNHLAIKKCPLL